MIALRRVWPLSLCIPEPITYYYIATIGCEYIQYVHYIKDAYLFVYYYYMLHPPSYNWQI